MVGFALNPSDIFGVCIFARRIQITCMLTCPFLPLPVYRKCPYLDRIVLLSQLLKGKNRDKCDTR